jgi:hypothetical protein
MMFAATRRTLALLLFSALFLFTQAQSSSFPGNDPKPYRILTSGKQVTVKSTKDIKTVMVWAASGHRIVEQKEVNATSFSFRIGVNEKVFFVMLELKGEERYTEKIGVQ